LTLPDAGICAYQQIQLFLFFKTYFYFWHSSIRLYDRPPIQLPTVQNGISGNWSGPGVISNSFNQTDKMDSLHTFSPDAGNRPFNTTIIRKHLLYP
jgi:hypothetical protein